MPQPVVADHSHAAQLLCGVQPVFPQFFQQQSAGQVGLRLLRGCQRSHIKRAEQGWHGSTSPEFGRRIGHCMPGARFQPGGGFDFQVDQGLVRVAKMRQLRQGRQCLAGETLAVPDPGIQAAQRDPGVLTCDLTGVAPEYLGGVRGAFQGGVMQQEGHAVGAQFDIALGHAVAAADPHLKRSQGIFGGQFAGASMGNPAWVGPGRKRSGVHDMRLSNARRKFSSVFVGRFCGDSAETERWRRPCLWVVLRSPSPQ